MAKSPEAFRTIGEVSDWLDTPPHVLRFWESRFAEVKPVKRAGGRRYYRPADMDLLGGIKKLLHDDGVTIRGVQKILQEKGVRHVAALCAPMAPPDAAPPPADVARRAEEAPAPQPAANATDAPVAAQPDAPPDAAPPAIDRAALRPLIARLQALSERMARPPMAK